MFIRQLWLLVVIAVVTAACIKAILVLLPLLKSSPSRHFQTEVHEGPFHSYAFTNPVTVNPILPILVVLAGVVFAFLFYRMFPVELTHKYPRTHAAGALHTVLAEVDTSALQSVELEPYGSVSPSPRGGAIMSFVDLPHASRDALLAAVTVQIPDTALEIREEEGWFAIETTADMEDALRAWEQVLLQVHGLQPDSELNVELRTKTRQRHLRQATDGKRLAASPDPAK
jgi:hypothetical protein